MRRSNILFVAMLILLGTLILAGNLNLKNRVSKGKIETKEEIWESTHQRRDVKPFTVLVLKKIPQIKYEVAEKAAVYLATTDGKLREQDDIYEYRQSGDTLIVSVRAGQILNNRNYYSPLHIRGLQSVQILADSTRVLITSPKNAPRQASVELIGGSLLQLGIEPSFENKRTPLHIDSLRVVAQNSSVEIYPAVNIERLSLKMEGKGSLTIQSRDIRNADIQTGDEVQLKIPGAFLKMINRVEPLVAVE